MATKAAAAAKRFIQSLEVPEGPRAGKRIRLASFQRDFIDGALAKGVDTAVLSVGRGAGKSTLSAGLALAHLLGVTDMQPRREVIIAARTRDQAKIAWQFMAGLARSLPEEDQAALKFRRSPVLEIEYRDEHVARCIAADAKGALGAGPTMVLMDERAAWPGDKGDELEAALLTSTGKRGARTVIISTSAADDANTFSRWLDEDREGVYRQEHRPAPGLPADDLDSLLLANPGVDYGVGPSREWLLASARRAIQRGGSALASFRNLNRNERVSGEARDVLLTTDEWLACEADALPPREGPAVVGIDLGGSASMTAAAFYWPATGRLEARGWFPSRPSLVDRGARDGVGSRYCEMADRGELATLGEATVPVAPWLAAVMQHVAGETIAGVVADRFKASELGEAMQRAGVRAPIVWRGMGFRDGGEDVERFRRAAFDGRVTCAPSLLMRSALADAVVVRDPAGNPKLAKGRSLGRIDAASAAVLAVAEGSRQSGRRQSRGARIAWA
jgi:phage terminase large subunit-like protein